MLSLTTTGTPSSAPGVVPRQPRRRSRRLASARHRRRAIAKMFRPSRPGADVARPIERCAAALGGVDVAARDRRRAARRPTAASARHDAASGVFVRRRAAARGRSRRASAGANASSGRASGIGGPSSARSGSPARADADRRPRRRSCRPATARPCARGSCSARRRARRARSSVRPRRASAAMCRTSSMRDGH